MAPEAHYTRFALPLALLASQFAGDIETLAAQSERLAPLVLHQTPVTEPQECVQVLGGDRRVAVDELARVAHHEPPALVGRREDENPGLRSGSQQIPLFLGQLISSPLVENLPGGDRAVAQTDGQHDQLLNIHGGDAFVGRGAPVDVMIAPARPDCNTRWESLA